MAAARDQAARIIRTGPETADGEAVRENSAHLADQLRTHVAEETSASPPRPPPLPRPTSRPRRPPPLPRRNPAKVNS